MSSAVCWTSSASRITSSPSTTHGTLAAAACSSWPPASRRAPPPPWPPAWVSGARMADRRQSRPRRPSSSFTGYGKLSYSMAEIESLQQHVRNRLPREALRHRWLAGILGDHPSTYSRSPVLWNTAFERLGLDARYVPLDVEASDLERFVHGLRRCESLLGINVTAPYKQHILPYLDELDPMAAAIG